MSRLEVYNRSYCPFSRRLRGMVSDVCTPHFCPKLCAIPRYGMIDWVIDVTILASLPFFLIQYLGVNFKDPLWCRWITQQECQLRSCSKYCTRWTKEDFSRNIGDFRLDSVKLEKNNVHHVSWFWKSESLIVQTRIYHTSAHNVAHIPKPIKRLQPAGVKRKLFTIKYQILSTTRCILL